MVKDEKRTVKLKIIIEVGQLILSTLDLQKLYSEVLHKIQQHFDYYHLTFWLLDKKVNELTLTAHAGYKQSQLALGYRLPLDKGIIGWVIKNEQTRFVQDSTKDNEYYAPNQTLVMKSEIATPVKTAGNLYGVLNVESENVGDFDEFDVSVFETVANLFAIAISNARLYGEVQSFNKILNDKVREKTEELKQAHEKILDQQRLLKKENSTLRKIIHHHQNLDQEPIGNSKELETLLAMVDKIAPTNATVLVQGESGTGKELVARRLHERSVRGDKPYVTINCGALQESLLESELFGHEKGAFTGAHTQKIGLVETADGGSLFLDEIGELGAGIQAKILRFLQEGEIYRVGGKKALKVDVRIISATNKDLEKEVKAKNFREDLFYRINTITLRMPPLRKRKEDIPLLVEHFLKNTRYGGVSNRTMGREALGLLEEYDWPGNIRELQNVIERVKILAERDEITPEDIRYNIQFPVRIRSDLMDVYPTTMGLDELERSHILKTLDYFKGNKTKAANALGITIKTLYNKLHKYQPEKTEH